MKDEIFIMSRVWDKEKIQVPDGNGTSKHLMGALSTELRELVMSKAIFTRSL